MAFWSFKKDAGPKVIEEPKAEAGADSFLKQTQALQAELAKYQLDKTGLDVKVEGDTVKLSGKAASPEIKEKVILAAGNIAGIATVEAEDDGAPEPVFYTVKKGDTLSAIAKATLGSANRYPEIFEANKPMLSHPDKIYPGQTLRIPQAPGTTA